ncbi:MAG: sugar ABC transporter substrate-binding protein, partial [Devosia sp.]
MLKHLRLTAAVGAVLLAWTTLAGSAQAQTAPKVAVDLTTLTSPFWTAYNKYIEDEAKAQGIDLL